MDDKQRIIAKIMDEVADTELRDKLLRTVTDGGEPRRSDQPRHSERDRDRDRDRGSVLEREMKHLGIDSEGAKNYVGFQVGAGVVSGYIIGGLFLIGGLISAVNHWSKNPGGVLFSLIFAAMGVLSLISTSKMLRIRDKGKTRR